MSIVVEDPFRDSGTYDLKYACNRLLTLLAAVSGMAQEALDVAMLRDNGYGGVLEGSELDVIDAAEALSGELYRLSEALPEFKKMVDDVVNGGYACLPEDAFD